MKAQPSAGNGRGLAAILVNASKAEAGSMSEEMIPALGRDGWSTLVLPFDRRPGASALEGADILVSLGGDGTVLSAARMAAPFGVPILPVNLGTLGFIAWVKRAEWRERFDEAASGRLAVSERMMLDIVVDRGGAAVAGYSALNDGVVSGAGLAKIVNLSISVNDTPLGRYRSDGLIVSTPTGSTAYSLAAGGPVLDPDMEAILFTPICPFTLSNRPLVIPAGETLELVVEPGQREATILTVDGQEVYALEEGDRVRFKRSAFKARLYRRERGSFYQVLRSKLNWSGGVDA